MPLYEYQCLACGHRFEIIRKFSDPPIEACGACGGTVRKLQSASAFHLKGSGWYITDYAKKDQSAAATPEDGSKQDSKSANKDEASTKKDDKTSTSTEPAPSSSSAAPVGSAPAKDS